MPYHAHLSINQVTTEFLFLYDRAAQVLGEVQRKKFWKDNLTIPIEMKKALTVWPSNSIFRNLSGKIWKDVQGYHKGILEAVVNSGRREDSKDFQRKVTTGGVKHLILFSWLREEKFPTLSQRLVWGHIQMTGKLSLGPHLPPAEC